MIQRFIFCMERKLHFVSPSLSRKKHSSREKDNLVQVLIMCNFYVSIFYIYIHIHCIYIYTYKYLCINIYGYMYAQCTQCTGISKVDMHGGAFISPLYISHTMFLVSWYVVFKNNWSMFSVLYESFR